MLKRKGVYLGTEINEKWWKRYRKDRFFHEEMVNTG